MATNILDKQVQLKEAYERETRILSEYNNKDNLEYPGWTFLVPDVLKVYEICPFLDPTSGAERRKNWLENQVDNGKVYFDVVERLTDDVKWNSLKESVTRNLDLLTAYVEGAVDSTVQEPHHRFDTLMQNVKEYKDTRSKNKKVKDMWDAMLLVIDYIVMSTGVDFGTYLQVAHNINIKYKCPQTGLQLDPKFLQLCQNLQESRSLYATEEAYRKSQKSAAKAKLVEIIDNNFQIDQSGKYYKRWSLLTQDQKHERIHSYVQWYCRKYNVSVNNTTDIENFVLQALLKNELKSTDIQWETKSGIISNIKILIDENGKPNLKPKVKSAITTPRKRSSKKKNKVNPFQENPKHEGRMNRLLLYHILSRRGLRKEDTLERVLADFNPSPVIRAKLSDYLSTAYDSMVDKVMKASK